MSRRDRRAVAATAQTDGALPAPPDAAPSDAMPDAVEPPSPADAAPLAAPLDAPADPPAPEPMPAEPPAPEPPPITHYRVVRGYVCVGSRVVGPGRVIRLTPSEAASLSAHLEPA